MIVVKVIVASILTQSFVTSSSHSFCDFPQGATPFVANSVCAPLVDNRIQCEASIYQSITKCYWDQDRGYCTSVAVATGEDSICPYITSPTKCAQSRFLHHRACVWFEAPTDLPSQMPSIAPSNGPTMSPSNVPSSAPTMVDYCGLPFVEDPWAFPRELCSNATNPVECGRDALSTQIQCYWSNEVCTSEYVDTGEDNVCPIVRTRAICISNSYSLDRPCVWYGSQYAIPTRHPSDVPSRRPSLAPTPLPTPRLTRSPTPLPTRRPIPEPTLRPTRRPTIPPTSRPTVGPSSAPTLMPSQSPSNKPSSKPTRPPSASPSLHPSPYPSPFPTRAPTKKPTRHPSFEPSNAPTTNPSISPSTSPSSAPSSLPTKIAVEELIHVCRCNDEFLCFDKPHAQGEELSICGWVQAPVVMEMVKFLQLSQYPIQQTVVQDDSGIDGGSLFWSGDLSSFVLRVVIDDDFFEKPTGLVAIGRIRYSLSQRRRTDESIFVVSNEEFTFRLEIPLAQPDSSGGAVSEATSPDREKEESKGSMNLQIWIPAAVAGAAAIALLLFMFSVITSRRNDGRKRMSLQKAQSE